MKARDQRGILVHKHRAIMCMRWNFGTDSISGGFKLELTIADFEWAVPEQRVSTRSPLREHAHTTNLAILAEHDSQIAPQWHRMAHRHLMSRSIRLKGPFMVTASRCDVSLQP